MKYSRETAQMVVAAIAQGGLPVTTAVKVAGIGRTTHYRWMRQNEEYRQAVERAEGLREQGLVDGIKAKGSSDWKSDAWLLERTSADYRETKKLDIAVQQHIEGLLLALQGEMSEGAYDELVDAIARLQGLDEEGETAAGQGAEAGYACLPAPASGDPEHE